MLRRVSSFLLWLVFWGQLAPAQVTTGTLSGRVTDETPAVVLGVTVTIRNLDTGITRTISTDAQGRYSAPSLGLGSYEVQVEMAGFQTEVRTGITLTVGREAVGI